MIKTRPRGSSRPREAVFSADDSEDFSLYTGGKVEDIRLKSYSPSAERVDFNPGKDRKTANRGISGYKEISWMKP